MRKKKVGGEDSSGCCERVVEVLYSGAEKVKVVSSLTVSRDLFFFRHHMDCCEGVQVDNKVCG